MKALINAAIHHPRSLYGFRPWSRHGLVLVVLGIIYMATGSLFILADTTPQRNENLKVALDLWGWTGWGMIWIICGWASILSSRWPIPSDKWGYSVLSGLSTLWGCFYFFGWVEGAPIAALGQTLVYGAVAFVIWAISGLLNPVPATLAVVVPFSAEPGTDRKPA